MIFLQLIRVQPRELKSTLVERKKRVKGSDDKWKGRDVLNSEDKFFLDASGSVCLIVVAEGGDIYKKESDDTPSVLVVNPTKCKTNSDQRRYITAISDGECASSL